MNDIPARYYLAFAAAFIRGKRSDAPDLPDDELFAWGMDQGLRLNKFKRTAQLPRVRRVIGLLRQLNPQQLLDVGSGRGVFLWPLLDTFESLRVHAIDARDDRVADIQAVRAGGVARLEAQVMDVTRLSLGEDSVEGVTMLEVLEHLEHPARAIAELVRVARRFIVLSVPSKEDDNPEHLHLFDEKHLRRLFASAGVDRVSVDYVLNHIVAVAMLEAEA